MRIAARLALQAPLHNERREPRDDVSVPTTMRALGYHGIDVVIRNISEHGFMAESEGGFPTGAYVRLKLPGLGTINARIVWARGGQVGGEFVHPIAPARLHRAIGLAGATVSPFRPVA